MSGDGRDGSSDSWHNLSTATVTGIQCYMMMPPPLSPRSCIDCRNGRPNNAIKHILPPLCCYLYQYWPVTSAGQMLEEVDINMAGCDIMFHVSSHSRPWEWGWWEGCSALRQYRESTTAAPLHVGGLWTRRLFIGYWLRSGHWIFLWSDAAAGYQFAQSPVSSCVSSQFYELLISTVTSSHRTSVNSG